MMFHARQKGSKSPEEGPLLWIILRMIAARKKPRMADAFFIA